MKYPLTRIPTLLVLTTLLGLVVVFNVTIHHTYTQLTGTEEATTTPDMVGFSETATTTATSSVAAEAVTPLDVESASTSATSTPPSNSTVEREGNYEQALTEEMNPERLPVPNAQSCHEEPLASYYANPGECMRAAVGR